MISTCILSMHRQPSIHCVCTLLVQWNLSWETTAMRDHLSWKTTHFWQKALHFNITEPVTKTKYHLDHLDRPHFCGQWGGLSRQILLYVGLIFIFWDNHTTGINLLTSPPGLSPPPPLSLSLSLHQKLVHVREELYKHHSQRLAQQAEQQLQRVYQQAENSVEQTLQQVQRQDMAR